MSVSKSPSSLFTFSVWCIAFATSFALGVYAYLGLFTRHLADDYCTAAFTQGNFFTALWQNYLTVSNRFTKFILIALSEFISPHSVAVLPALMIILWVIGIMWLLREAARYAGQTWPPAVILSLSLLLAFISLLEAPNRYQTLYWRASLTTHFAPLVFMPYLAAFLLSSIISSRTRPHPRWLYPLSFFLAFFLGGFSEPTLAVMISLLALVILVMWIYSKSPERNLNLALLAWTLSGAVLALVVMIFAPANSLRLGSAPPGLTVLVERSFRYGFDFVRDSLKSLILPSFFATITPMVIFYGLNISSPSSYSRAQQKNIWITLALVPVLSYLLVVASFAPSVYGQSFPVDRARFAGQVSLVAALMIEGAALGILLAQWRPRIINNLPIGAISAILLIVAAFYPLRSAWLTMADIPSYRARAQAWDERESIIFSLREQGQTDLAVPQLSGVDGIKELDNRAEHWVNRCAAEYYGVNSIQAFTVHNP